MNKADLKQIEALFEKNNKLIFKRFDKIDSKFDQIDKKFDQIDKKFDQIDKRFEQVDKRFEQVDKRLEQMDKRLDLADQKFERYTRLAESRFTNLLNICTALRADQNSPQRQAETKALESRVTALEVTVKDIERRINS